MKEIKIYTEYVTLGLFLNLADIIQTGGEAKFFLSENRIIINGEEDNRRGRKLREGDVVEVLGKSYKITNEG